MSEPIHIISLGAGVQSSTMSLMAAAGEITPMPVAAIFADTQAEPASVYRWLDWLEKQLPFPVHRVTAGNLAERELKVIRSVKSGKDYRKSGIPLFLKQPNGSIGIISRKCTRDFKIAPIQKWLREQHFETVIQWFGISLDEAHRMKDSQIKWISHRYPLVDNRLSRNDCLLWMQRKGHPTPPKSACVFCPYHSDSQWRSLIRSQVNGDDGPFEQAVRFEKMLQKASSNDTTTSGVPFLHRSCVPLDQVDFSTEEERGQLEMFGNDCDGVCGV